jgi:hypothetical protein
MALSVLAGAHRNTVDEHTYLVVYVHDENGNPVLGLKTRNFRVSLFGPGLSLPFDDFWSVDLGYFHPGAYQLTLDYGPLFHSGQTTILVEVRFSPLIPAATSVEAVTAAMGIKPAPDEELIVGKGLKPVDEPDGYGLATLVYFPTQG